MRNVDLKDVSLSLGVDERLSRSDFIMQTLRFPIEDLTCVLFIPNDRFSTLEARKLVPDHHPKSDVTQNIGRAAMFVAALLTKNYDNLKYAVEDRLHEPYRAPSCPGFGLIKDVIPVTDALAACLSGAGPATIIFTRKSEGTDIVTDLKRLGDPELSSQGHFIEISVSAIGVHVVKEAVSPVSG